MGVRGIGIQIGAKGSPQGNFYYFIIESSEDDGIWLVKWVKIPLAVES